MPLLKLVLFQATATGIPKTGLYPQNWLKYLKTTHPPKLCWRILLSSSITFYSKFWHFRHQISKSWQYSWELFLQSITWEKKKSQKVNKKVLGAVIIFAWYTCALDSHPYQLGRIRIKNVQAERVVDLPQSRKSRAAQRPFSLFAGSLNSNNSCYFSWPMLVSIYKDVLAIQSSLMHPEKRPKK